MSKAKVTVKLISLQYYRLHPHSLSVCDFPTKTTKTFNATLWLFHLILYFACSPLSYHPPPTPQHFHSQAQTALALTPGHPMFSLSNYLTNHSETALISAYCSAWLNTASLGGLSGKLWCGDQQARQAEKGEQQKWDLRNSLTHQNRLP